MSDVFSPSYAGIIETTTSRVATGWGDPGKFLKADWLTSNLQGAMTELATTFVSVIVRRPALARAINMCIVMAGITAEPLLPVVTLHRQS